MSGAHFVSRFRLQPHDGQDMDRAESRSSASNWRLRLAASAHAADRALYSQPTHTERARAQPNEDQHYVGGDEDEDEGSNAGRHRSRFVYASSSRATTPRRWPATATQVTNTTHAGRSADHSFIGRFTPTPAAFSTTAATTTTTATTSSSSPSTALLYTNTHEPRSRFAPRGWQGSLAAHKYKASNVKDEEEEEEHARQGTSRYGAAWVRPALSSSMATTPRPASLVQQKQLQQPQPSNYVPVRRVASASSAYGSSSLEVTASAPATASSSFTPRFKYGGGGMRGRRAITMYDVHEEEDIEAHTSHADVRPTQTHSRWQLPSVLATSPAAHTRTAAVAAEAESAPPWRAQNTNHVTASFAPRPAWGSSAVHKSPARFQPHTAEETKMSAEQQQQHPEEDIHRAVETHVAHVCDGRAQSTHGKDTLLHVRRPTGSETSLLASEAEDMSSEARQKGVAGREEGEDAQDSPLPSPAALSPHVIVHNEVHNEDKAKEEKKIDAPTNMVQPSTEDNRNKWRELQHILRENTLVNGNSCPALLVELDLSGVRFTEAEWSSLIERILPQLCATEVLRLARCELSDRDVIRMLQQGMAQSHTNKTNSSSRSNSNRDDPRAWLPVLRVLDLRANALTYRGMTHLGRWLLWAADTMDQLQLSQNALRDYGFQILGIYLAKLTMAHVESEPELFCSRLVTRVRTRHERTLNDDEEAEEEGGGAIHIGLAVLELEQCRASPRGISELMAGASCAHRLHTLYLGQNTPTADTNNNSSVSAGEVDKEQRKSYTASALTSDTTTTTTAAASTSPTTLFASFASLHCPAALQHIEFHAVPLSQFCTAIGCRELLLNLFFCCPALAQLGLSGVFDRTRIAQEELKTLLHEGGRMLRLNRASSLSASGTPSPPAAAATQHERSAGSRQQVYAAWQRMQETMHTFTYGPAHVLLAGQVRVGDMFAELCAHAAFNAVQRAKPVPPAFAQLRLLSLSNSGLTDFGACALCSALVSARTRHGMLCGLKEVQLSDNLLSAQGCVMLIRCLFSLDKSTAAAAAKDTGNDDDDDDDGEEDDGVCAMEELWLEGNAGVGAEDMRALEAIAVAAQEALVQRLHRLLEPDRPGGKPSHAQSPGLAALPSCVPMRIRYGGATPAKVYMTGCTAEGNTVHSFPHVHTESGDALAEQLRLYLHASAARQAAAKAVAPKNNKTAAVEAATSKSPVHVTGRNTTSTPLQEATRPSAHATPVPPPLAASSNAVAAAAAAPRTPQDSPAQLATPAHNNHHHHHHHNSSHDVSPVHVPLPTSADGQPSKRPDMMPQAAAAAAAVNPLRASSPRSSPASAERVVVRSQIDLNDTAKNVAAAPDSNNGNEHEASSSPLTLMRAGNNNIVNANATTTTTTTASTTSGNTHLLHHHGYFYHAHSNSTSTTMDDPHRESMPDLPSAAAETRHVIAVQRPLTRMAALAREGEEDEEEDKTPAPVLAATAVAASAAHRHTRAQSHEEEAAEGVRAASPQVQPGPHKAARVRTVHFPFLPAPTHLLHHAMPILCSMEEDGQRARGALAEDLLALASASPHASLEPDAATAITTSGVSKPLPPRTVLQVTCDTFYDRSMQTDLLLITLVTTERKSVLKERVQYPLTVESLPEQQHYFPRLVECLRLLATSAPPHVDAGDACYEEKEEEGADHNVQDKHKEDKITYRDDDEKEKNDDEEDEEDALQSSRSASDPPQPDMPTAVKAHTMVRPTPDDARVKNEGGNDVLQTQAGKKGKSDEDEEKAAQEVRGKTDETGPLPAEYDTFEAALQSKAAAAAKPYSPNVSPANAALRTKTFVFSFTHRPGTTLCRAWTLLHEEGEMGQLARECAEADFAALLQPSQDSEASNNNNNNNNNSNSAVFEVRVVAGDVSLNTLQLRVRTNERRSSIESRLQRIHNNSTITASNSLEAMQGNAAAASSPGTLPFSPTSLMAAVALPSDGFASLAQLLSESPQYDALVVLRRYLASTPRRGRTAHYLQQTYRSLDTFLHYCHATPSPLLSRELGFTSLRQLMEDAIALAAQPAAGTATEEHTPNAKDEDTHAMLHEVTSDDDDDDDEEHDVRHSALPTQRGRPVPLQGASVAESSEVVQADSYSASQAAAPPPPPAAQPSFSTPLEPDSYDESNAGKRRAEDESVHEARAQPAQNASSAADGGEGETVLDDDLADGFYPSSSAHAPASQHATQHPSQDNKDAVQQRVKGSKATAAESIQHSPEDEDDFSGLDPPLLPRRSPTPQHSIAATSANSNNKEHAVANAVLSLERSGAEAVDTAMPLVSPSTAASSHVSAMSNARRFAPGMCDLSPLTPQEENTEVGEGEGGEDRRHASPRVSMPLQQEEQEQQREQEVVHTSSLPPSSQHSLPSILSALPLPVQEEREGMNEDIRSPQGTEERAHGAAAAVNAQQPILVTESLELEGSDSPRPRRAGRNANAAATPPPPPPPPLQHHNFVNNATTSNSNNNNNETAVVVAERPRMAHDSGSTAAPNYTPTTNNNNNSNNNNAHAAYQTDHRHRRVGSGATVSCSSQADAMDNTSTQTPHRSRRGHPSRGITERTREKVHRHLMQLALDGMAKGSIALNPREQQTIRVGKGKWGTQPVLLTLEWDVMFALTFEKPSRPFVSKKRACMLVHPLAFGFDCMPESTNHKSELRHNLLIHIRRPYTPESFGIAPCDIESALMHGATRTAPSRAAWPGSAIPNASVTDASSEVSRTSTINAGAGMLVARLMQDNIVLAVTMKSSKQVREAVTILQDGVQRAQKAVNEAVKMAKVARTSARYSSEN